MIELFPTLHRIRKEILNPKKNLLEMALEKVEKLIAYQRTNKMKLMNQYLNTA
jgi:hypothetical protein